MQLKRSVQLTALILGIYASSPLHAAGFALLEQNASGLGNAFAGTAAIADNASTIFFNPAGMTYLQAHEISFGVNAVNTSFKFNNEGSSSGVLTGNGGDAGGLEAVPNGYFSWAINKDLFLGLGISAPFGLASKYDTPWVGSAQATEFEVATINVNPSLAYRVNDKVSLGIGANWQRMTANYKRAALATSTPGANTQVEFDGDSDAWGWNAGIMFQVSPTMRIGASYRSEIDHDIDGDLKITGSLAGLTSALSNRNAKADITLPGSFIVSAFQKLTDKWDMQGDIQWTNWSKIKELSIVNTSGALSGATAQTLTTDFRDTWRVAYGMTYHTTDVCSIKFGIAYDQTPVRNAETRLVSLPDSDRTWLTLGGQWKPTKTSAVDIGLAYIYLPDAKIDNNQLTAGRGRVTGSYDSSIWIAGAQLSFAF